MRNALTMKILRRTPKTPPFDDILAEYYDLLYRHVRRIATNEALRHLSRRHDIDTGLDDEALPELEDEPYVDNSDRLATALAKAMTVLTPRQRQVFDLRHYDGMSFADISAIAGMAEDTARATFHQTRAKLRDILQSMDIHP